MKKLFKLALLGAVLVWLGVLPFHGRDIRELLPAQTVIVTRAGDCYAVDVGAGVRGLGRTLEEALAALKERVTGTLFFETVNQLIVHEDAAEILPQAAESTAFRPGAYVYLTSGDPDPEAVTAWLETRTGGLTLARLRGRLASGEPGQVPRLEPDGGGFVLAP